MNAQITPREKVTFPINEPVLLRLDYDKGKLTAGKFGDQYQCTFDKGQRIAWLDPDVHALIVQTGARAGDEIAITKRQTKNGNTKTARWEVEKVEDEANAAWNAEEAARAAQDTRREPMQTAPLPAVQQPAPQKQAAAPRTSPRDEAISQTARTFADCIAAALEAAHTSSIEAQASGFALPWDKADIRAIATTLYIQRAGRGGQ